MRPDQRGETLVEVVMALAILSLVLVSSYALATGTFRVGRGAGERTQAVNYLQEQAESLRSYRDKSASWADFVQSIQQYNGSPAENRFCMKKDSTTNSWKPVATTGGDCTIGGITISVITKVDGSYVGPDGLADLYRFDFMATWKTGSTDNNVLLNTKLTRQK